MSDNVAEGAALREWLNSFPLPDKIRSLNDLNDGRVLWQVLRDIDANYFAEDLPEQGPKLSDHWLPRWQNIKQINKTLTNYILDQCDQSLPPNTQATQDLKAIATAASAVETTKGGNQALAYHADADRIEQLLKMILLAAINSPKAMEYIGKMPTLNTATQASLKSIIEEVLSALYIPVARILAQTNSLQMQTTGNNAPDDSSSLKTPSGLPLKGQAMDPELFFEERIGKVMADNDDLSRDKRELEKQLRDLHDRLARLQDNNDVLQERLTEAEDRLELNGSAKGANGAAEDSSTKQLENRIQNQEDLIATQETKLSNYQSSTEEMQKMIEKLRASSGKSQTLRDELDELKIERDALAKKANTIDKYKQKLQAGQNLEKENRYLRAELDELRQQWKDVDMGQQKTAGLQLAIDEYKRILPKIEQDRHELQMMKRQLEFDNAALAQRWETANEQQARDRETISDLTDKIREVESGQVSAFLPSGGLEEELSKSTKTEFELQAACTLLMCNQMLTDFRKSEIIKLSGEVQELKKTTPGAGAKSVMLQQLLNDANQKHAALEEKYFEAYQDKLVLESSLADVQQGHPIERYSFRKSTPRILTYNHGSTEVFQKMREQQSNTKLKLSETEDELARTKRQLMASQSDLSMIGKAEREALEELEDSNSKELTDLRNEHSLLERRTKGLEADLDEHTALLRKALRDKSDGQKNLAQQGDQHDQREQSSNDLKSTLEILKAASMGRTEGHSEAVDEMLEKHVKHLAMKNTNGRERVAKLTEVNARIFSRDAEESTAIRWRSLSPLMRRASMFVTRADLLSEQHTRKQNTVIRELQDKLKKLEEGDREGLAGGRTESAAEQKIDQQEELQNLQRETKLMATAWYDLTSRLQMNNVVLQRRNDTPRSFLNKQRHLLNQTSVRTR
ncbi:MAG: hypothetical protein M1830_002824 [Pleopsidium flavum]|nr:MAG: hypothetical protein M1830_002824 [Pleopsidium flavum]